MSEELFTLGYEAALREEHLSCDRWGRSAVRFGGFDVLHTIKMWEVKTMLDYGCGKGGLKEFVNEWMPHVDVTNYDPGVEEYRDRPTGRFDLVTTLDVMEHIEPHCKGAVIRDIASLSHRVIYNNIACTKTAKFRSGIYAGMSKHLIVQRPEHWRADFDHFLPKGSNLWEYHDWGRYKKGSLRPRVTMTHEVPR